MITIKSKYNEVLGQTWEVKSVEWLMGYLAVCQPDPYESFIIDDNCYVIEIRVIKNEGTHK